MVQNSLMPCKLQINWHGHAKRISRKLGNKTKWDQRPMQHFPVKTQYFVHFGISRELGNRKKRDQRHIQHLRVKTMFCAVWNKLQIRE